MDIKITDARGKYFATNIETNIIMIDDYNFDIVFKCGKIQMKGNAEKLINLFEEWKNKNVTCFNYDLRLE